MQLTQNNQMIKLVLELRRRLPEDIRNTIRLTDPNILDHLIRLHNTQNDARVRDVISQIMALAGKDWTEQLTPVACSPSANSPKEKGEHQHVSVVDTVDNTPSTQASLIVH